MTSPTSAFASLVHVTSVLKNLVAPESERKCQPDADRMTHLYKLLIKKLLESFFLCVGVRGESSKRTCSATQSSDERGGYTHTHAHAMRSITFLFFFLFRLFFPPFLLYVIQAKLMLRSFKEIQTQTAAVKSYRISSNVRI